MKVKTPDISYNILKEYSFKEIPKNLSVNFPRGIIGFEDFTQFKLSPRKNSPFFTLEYCGKHTDKEDTDKACNDKKQTDKSNPLMFILLNLFKVIPRYDLLLGKEDQKTLRIDNNDFLALYLITNISEAPMRITVNALAPVVINLTKRFGEEIMRMYPHCLSRHPVDLDSLRL